MRYDLPPGASVIVIGAGVAGLATATLLAREGYQVHCIEKLPTAGGRVGTIDKDGWRFDTGPSWYLMPEVFEHYFELLGTTAAEQLELVRLHPAYSIIQVERAHPESQQLEKFSDITGWEQIAIPADYSQLQQLFEQREPGAGQRLEEYLRNAEQAYELAKQYFLYTSFRSVRPWLTPTLLRHGAWLVRLLTSSLEAYVQRYFQDPLLRQILLYPAVFLATTPKKAPALYHILSHTDLAQGVFYPQGGFHGFVRRLESLAMAAGVEFHFAEEVQEIMTTEALATGVRTNQGTYLADAIVSCADREFTNRITNWSAKKDANAANAGVGAAIKATLHLERRTPANDAPALMREQVAKYWQQRHPGISAVVVFLGIDGALPQLPHHTLILSKDWDADFAAVWELENPQGDQASSSVYVCRTSATDPTAAPEGKENLFILVPTASEPSIGHGSLYGVQSPEIAKIASAAIKQLSTVLETDLTARIEVQETIGPADFVQRYHAWQGSALGLAHTLRQSAWMRGKQYDPRIHNLLYAGATSTPGVGLPMCLISAENIVKIFRGDTSTQRLPADS
ncbi:MAG: phytoene desaturase family protein [Corynebacterium sp.]|nr:phytoene desaturase family protein [Corynebacterium sp.]